MSRVLRTAVRRRVRRGAAATLLLVGLGTLSAAAASYDWRPLRIGGAGWVTGMALHPSSPDVVYARTDVGGAYRWVPDGERWEQLLTDVSVPNGVSADYDVESIAVAPSDDSVLYLAVGGDSPNGQLAPTGTVLSSTDGGASFTRSSRTFTVSGNAPGRQGGERLAVDPADARRVLFGTRYEGLFLSTDGGLGWTRVPALPAGQTQGRGALGIKLVRFDPTSATGAGVTPRVYASVSGDGVYRSDDGGLSWRRILDADAGIGYDAEVSSQGELLVAFLDGEPLRRYDPVTDGWTDISPPSNRNTGQVSIAVDPFDPDRLFFATDGVTNGRLFRSTDGGASWDALQSEVDVGAVRWRDGFATNFLSVSSMEFDPLVPDRLWFPEGFGVLRTSDLDDDAVTWRLLVDGIEELVGTDVVKPPGGRPVTTHLDAPIFYHPDPGGTGFDAVIGPTKRFNSGYDIAYAPSRPSRLAAIVQDQRLECCFDGRKNQSGLSDDGGRTWRLFGSLANGTHPADLIFGNIEIGAANPDELVWLPSFDAPVRWSDDGGDSWTEANIPGATGTAEPGSHSANFLTRQVLAADPQAAGTFYLYHDDLGIVSSADGGRNWTVLGFDTLLRFANFNAKLKAAPDRTGELWFTPGIMNNIDTELSRSRDGGASWTAIEGVTNVEALGFGAPAAPGDYPSLYISGEVGGVRGLYRSTDEGVGWEDIGRPLGVYDEIVAIDGDPDAFGTVYVNIGGVGAAVGVDPDPPVRTATCDVTLPQNRTRLESNRWTLLSLPCVPPPGEATLVDLFGDDIAGTYRADWVAYAYDASGGYERLQASATLAPGQGFWLLSRSPAATLRMPTGSTRAPDDTLPDGACASNAGCFAKSLSTDATSRATWTLVGNPWPAPTRVPFDGLRIVADLEPCTEGCTLDTASGAGLASRSLYRYDGTGYPRVAPGDTLAPWEGFWTATPPKADGTMPRLVWPR